MIINHVIAEDPSDPVFRYRVLIPGPAIMELGHQVWIDDEPKEDAVNVFHDGAELCEVIDVVQDGQVTFAAEHASTITCSSRYLGELIGQKGRVAHYIPDPWEFEEQQFTWSGGKTVLWFGRAETFDTLKGVELDCPIECVLDCQEPGSTTDVRMTPWSMQTMRHAFSQHDIVIIPETALWKGANRAVNALRQGKFVVASETPAINELQDFVYVCRGEPILNGVQWARAHADAAATMVAAGQAYVAKWFSPEFCAAQWLSVLESLEIPA